MAKVSFRCSCNSTFFVQAHRVAVTPADDTGPAVPNIVLDENDKSDMVIMCARCQTLWEFSQMAGSFTRAARVK